MSACTKGWIKNNTSGTLKKFQYNPEGLSYSRGANYVEIIAPGMSYPNTQYVSGTANVFSVELYLHDHADSGMILSFMRFIDGFLPPETNGSSFKKPPEMTFCFGYFIKRCVLNKCSPNVEMFSTSGNPIEVRLTLELRQVGV